MTDNVENTEEPRQLDRKDLKIMALKESLSEANEKNAELRVELTIAMQQVEQLGQILQGIQAQNSEASEAETATPEAADAKKEKD